MSRNFGKFCVNVMIVLVAVVCVDKASGIVLDRMVAKTGNTWFLGKTYYVVNDMDADAVVIGSSRAAYHYDSQILSDSIGMTTYNAGAPSCFFSHNCALIDAVLDRYSPRLIIWEFSPHYVYDETDDLSDLYPFYSSNNCIREFLNQYCDWDERVRLHSHLYQHNSKIHQTVILSLGMYDSSNDNGFKPKMARDYVPELEYVERPVDSGMDGMRIRLFEETVENIKSHGVSLILCNSPYYHVTDDGYRSLAFKSVCDSLGVTFVDYENCDYFMSHPEFFYDDKHLNNRGAEAFTMMFASRLNPFEDFK